MNPDAIHLLFNQLNQGLHDAGKELGDVTLVQLAQVIDGAHQDFMDIIDPPDEEFHEPYMGYTPGEDDRPERGAIPGEMYRA